MGLNIHEKFKKIKFLKQYDNQSVKTTLIIILFVICMISSYLLGTQNSNSKTIKNISKINSENKDTNTKTLGIITIKDLNPSTKIIGLPENNYTNNSASDSLKIDNLSNNNQASAIQSTYQDKNLNSNSNIDKTVFGSPRGKKYYLPWCSGGKTLKEKVYFKSEEDAVSKGYSKSTTCK